jgi:hypothetical protein
MLEVIDIMGNIIISQPINGSSQLATVDISKLSDGVYFYRLSAKSGVSEVMRFVKQ